MSARDDRKRVRAEHNDPISFCCGGCRIIQEFEPENPYCCECGYVKKKVEIEEAG